MTQTEAYPLRVESVPAAQLAEWRTGQTLPPQQGEHWQLVYVRSGVIEEQCGTRRVLLRPGGLLFHQPEETRAMRAVGEVPPEVLRVDFICHGAAMDAFRDRVYHAEPGEQLALGWVAAAAIAAFAPPAEPDAAPLLREDAPFAAHQQLALYLENLLILLARRARRTRRPSARLRKERRETALVENARLYFAQNLDQPVDLAATCAALGCSRTQLQQAFRARAHRGPMDELAAMRLEYAAQLLARGATPGEVAARLQYCSGAYFSQKFKAATGHTPSAYRRLQQGLPARRANTQQKDKADSKTSIPESAQKR